MAWCFARTARDHRLAARAGRPISHRELARLLARRIGRALGEPSCLELHRVIKLLERLKAQDRHLPRNGAARA